MQDLIKELWREMGATILFVTHNTSEAIRLASRVIVLARPSPDGGSRVALDMPISQPCSEESVPLLARKLECLDLGDVTASSPAEALSARS
jgi:ABC-type nitrate/sulfonate/bicarbonate transport system ATPase subunit